MCYTFINLRFWFHFKYFEIKPTKFGKRITTERQALHLIT